MSEHSSYIVGIEKLYFSLKYMFENWIEGLTLLENYNRSSRPDIIQLIRDAVDKIELVENEFHIIKYYKILNGYESTYEEEEPFKIREKLIQYFRKLSINVNVEMLMFYVKEILEFI